jgi:hypothetical protein
VYRASPGSWSGRRPDRPRAARRMSSGSRASVLSISTAAGTRIASQPGMASCRRPDVYQMTPAVAAPTAQTPRLRETSQAAADSVKADVQVPAVTIGRILSPEPPQPGRLPFSGAAGIMQPQYRPGGQSVARWSDQGSPTDDRSALSSAVGKWNRLNSSSRRPASTLDRSPHEDRDPLVARIGDPRHRPTLPHGRQSGQIPTLARRTPGRQMRRVQPSRRSSAPTAPGALHLSASWTILRL